MVERNLDGKIDIVAIYFEEASKAPFLTREEEIELARQRDLRKEAIIELEKNGLRPEKRRELELLINQGDEARKKLARSNLRWVISLASRFQGLGMSFKDLIQEGNVGLMRAVDRFDPDKGAKFSTYATWWIRQAIRRALPDQGRTIRVPIHANEERLQLEKVKNRLTKELGREPSQQELAKELDWSEEKVGGILNIPEVSLSLDEPVGEEKDSYLGEFIEDENSPHPSEETAKIMAGVQLREVVNLLPLREAEVLELRYGLKDGIFRTLEEVGRQLGVTRERARQIESQALRKLRYPAQARGLEDFLK